MNQETQVAVEQAERRGIKVFIDDNPYTFKVDEVTGQQLKERAGIPVAYSLYLRRPGGNEPIRDNEAVELRAGEHFFSRPPSNVS